MNVIYEMLEQVFNSHPVEVLLHHQGLGPPRHGHREGEARLGYLAVRSCTTISNEQGFELILLDRPKERLSPEELASNSTLRLSPIDEIRFLKTDSAPWGARQE